MKKLTRSAMGLVICLGAAGPLVLSGCQTSPQQRSAGQSIDDATITAKVKSQLLSDPDVSGLNVNVTTFKGQVQLSGYVESSNQRSKAEQIAKNVDGVKAVSNDLIVKAK